MPQHCTSARKEEAKKKKKKGRVENGTGCDLYLGFSFPEVHGGRQLQTEARDRKLWPPRGWGNEESEMLPSTR